jgi:hypothetical protein
MPGFEIQEEVVATHEGFVGQVTAWVPDRATYEADPTAASRHALTGPARTAEFALTVSQTLGRILLDYLRNRYGSPAKHGDGRPAEGAT